jgi:hypothetical protein
MAWEESAIGIAQAVWSRFIELAMAPLRSEEILWAALPLAIATIFMTLYFGKHSKEGISWNDAFGNAMVFMFVAIGLIRELYYQGGAGSWSYLLTNNLYFSITLGLIGASAVLMYITYYHLLPPRLAFVVFSTIPINVSVYVVMTVVYADMPSDYLTALAALLLLLVIFMISKILQFFERSLGMSDEAPDKTQERLDEMEKEEEEFEEEEKEFQKAKRK